MPGHGAIFDLALEAVAYDKLKSLTPLVDEPRYFREIMAAISVTEDDECATGLLDSFAQRTSVSLDARMYNACAMQLGNVDGVIGGAIVRDHHLACQFS